MGRTILACVVSVLVVGAATATAAKLVTSGDIKDGTIKSADIKNGTIKTRRQSRRAPSPAIAWRRRVRNQLDGGRTEGTRRTCRTPSETFRRARRARVPSVGNKLSRWVTAPGGGFSASPGGLTEFTPNGVVFGPFTDSAAQVRRECDSRAPTWSVKPLGDIAELTYSTGFNGTSDEPPYLRILVDVNGDGFNSHDCCEPGLDDHELVVQPGFPGRGVSVGPHGRLIKYETTEGTWAYDAPLEVGLEWDELVNAHADEPIFLIAITAVASAAGTTDAFLNSFSYELAGSAPVEVSFSN